jgi:AAA family ATPase
LESFSLEREKKWAWAARPTGVIIHGSAGTGKSHILKVISETGWGDIFRVSWDVKPSRLRDVFKEAKASRRSLIIIDDVERIVSKEHGGTQSLDLILGDEMDRLASGNDESHVLVVAATTTISDIPSTLRGFPRFTEEILLPIPNAESRRRILRSLVPKSSPDSFFTLLDGIGDRTHAYTPRDLQLLSYKAAEKAMARIRKAKTQNIDILDEWITQEDFEEALVIVRPSAMHDITLQPPKVRWDEIGGQDVVKKALRRAVETPLLVSRILKSQTTCTDQLQYPDILAQHARTPKKGILLYGPPGCSKTLSAQAMATQIGFNFFAVKGAELLNMYVGESERAVREVFARARAASPSIIFFDEIESIGSKREKRGNNGVNVLTTLLNEMDGIEALKGVFVLAATNKPEALDEALLRPGRFDDLLYVSPPDLVGREEILRNRGKISSWDEELISAIPELAGLLDGYSGAEVVGICQKASDAVIERSIDSGTRGLKVLRADFEEAMKGTRKQITKDMVKGYEDWAAGRRG